MAEYTGTVPGAVICAPIQTDVIENLSAAVDYSTPGTATVTVTAELSDDEAVTNRLLSDLDNDFVSSTISVGISGQKERIPLSADGEALTGGTPSASVTVPLDEEEKIYTAELYFGDELFFPMIAFVSVSPPLFITEDDFEDCSFTVKSSDGGRYPHQKQQAFRDPVGQSDRFPS